MIEETALSPQQVGKIAMGSGLGHICFTEIREIEIGCLDLRYAHTRVNRPEMLFSLVDSIERSGQIVPVITVKESDIFFVLIDGYLRVAALKPFRYEALRPIIRELFKPCRSNIVRVQETLQERYGSLIPYSTLTRIVRDLDLREDKGKHRAGSYTFPPGQEMQHDTSPHTIIIGEKKLKAQCAGLVLAYSRKLFIQYYPAFTRFEAKVFLTEAFLFMDGACADCTIDNTSVIVACGSGPDAEIAPEMEHFGHLFGVRFIPHRIGHADRKARIESNLSYAERNFLAGRSFSDWHDLNS